MGLFAVISCLVFASLITLFFFTDKIFKNYGMYCRCFSILCCPCPQNCSDLTSQFSSSLNLQTAPNPNEDEHLHGESNSVKISKENEEPDIQAFFYTRENKLMLFGKLLSENDMPLTEVKPVANDDIDQNPSESMRDEHEDKKPTITESKDEDESKELERPVSKDFECEKDGSKQGKSNVKQEEFDIIEKVDEDGKVDEEDTIPNDDEQEDTSRKSLPFTEPKENSLQKDLNRCDISNRKKIIIFIFIVCAAISIIIPLAITNEKTVNPYSCLPGYCSSMYGKSIHGNNNSVALACAMDPKCKAFRYSSQNKFGFLCDSLDRKKGYGDWELCGFWSENCTCAGVRNEFGHGSECKDYNGYLYPYASLNSKWCYTETTTCRDTTKVEYHPIIYVNEGRFGPSQTACSTNLGVLD